MPDDDAADNGLPDRALQSALEFAVGIAAAGAKLRPPLGFPAGLKPFLRFHKLPPSALAQVRTSVEGDAEFLRRLGLVASPELLDEVGVLWLTRPDGWQADATALAESAARRPADDAGDLRREQRRREAAEGAAARSRLELAGARDQLETERAARSAAEADVERLGADLAAARTQVAELQRAQKRRDNATEARGAKADAIDGELAGLRTELAATIAARDAALADRAAAHNSGPVDIERVRVLLVEALALTKGAEPKARRRVRKPLAVPGGIYRDSEAAAEHLLRTPDVVVLVDGYNVAKLGWPTLSLEQQRVACIDAAENLARRWGTLIHIVFDGASIVGARADRRRMVRVSFSPEGVIADDVLRAEVAAIDADRPVVVVTNDQAVVTDVRTAGANTVASEAFLALARR